MNFLDLEIGDLVSWKPYSSKSKRNIIYYGIIINIKEDINVMIVDFWNIHKYRFLRKGKCPLTKIS